MIYKIVLTGGPCGGKTSSIPLLKSFLEAKGWEVYSVPESATLLSGHGIRLGDPDPAMRRAVQVGILHTQMAMEDAMMAAAKASKQNAVVLCDRAIMDGKVYTPNDLWLPFLQSQELSELKVRHRYDAVFHMTSIANGAPHLYNFDNPARWEDVNQAVVNDIKTQNAWVGHPHLRVIDNSTDFPGKVARLCAGIEKFIASDHKEVERRFLIEPADIKQFELNRSSLSAVTLEVSQTYLKTTDGTVARWRMIGEAGHNQVVYTHTIKSPKVGASCTEIEKQLTSDEFNALKFSVDPTRSIITKRRHCFLWHGKQFELDEFTNPVKDMLILEVELDSESEEINIPPFLTVIKEVTTDPTFSNWNIASYGRNNAVEAHQ
jgi:CYTH domain-containing protein